MNYITAMLLPVSCMSTHNHPLNFASSCEGQPLKYTVFKKYTTKIALLGFLWPIEETKYSYSVLSVLFNPK